MITWTGSTIEIGDVAGAKYPIGLSIVLDAGYRNDTDVIATLYVQRGDAVVASFETAYPSATVNAETTTETTYTGKFNQAIHKLEKARLEALNPSATFTITL